MGILLVGLFLLLAIGVPIGMAFGLAGFAFGTDNAIPLESLASIPYESVTSFPLLAIPLFLLMGELMKVGQLADQLLAVVGKLVGRLRYSMGYIVVGTCAFLGAITGSSVATVSAVGGLVTRPMLDRGYPLSYIGAITASAGLLGCLIPPSIPLIIYGSTIGVSVADLFLASLVPGLLCVVLFAIVHRLVAPRLARDGTVPDCGANTPVLPAAAQSHWWDSLPALAMPIVVLGGIYGGVLTPTEAAAAGCVYALLICLLKRKRASNAIRSALVTAAIVSGAILAILAFASVFNRALTLAQVPMQLAEFALSLTTDPAIFLLLVNLVMLLVGMLMETNTAVLLMAPLLAPVAQRYGIDPLHFGVLLVTNIEVGLLTPPMAANIFVASKATGAPVASLLRYVWPFLLAALLLLLLITFLPILSTWPKLL